MERFNTNSILKRTKMEKGKEVKKERVGKGMAFNR